MFAINRKCCHSVIIAATLLCSAPALSQMILRVDGINGSVMTAVPPPDGSDWGAEAYLYLQDALDEARSIVQGSGSATVQVWVRGQNDSDGFTYFPDDGDGLTPGTQSLAFELETRVSIYGGFHNTHTVLSQRDLFTSHDPLR
jgi:hypothetical protein